MDSAQSPGSVALAGSPVAVVTGSARSIGLACVRWFLAHGHRVALIDIDNDTLARTDAELAAPARVRAGDVAR